MRCTNVSRIHACVFFSHCWFTRLCFWHLFWHDMMQLKKVKHLVELSKNDSLPLDYASQLCNSDILSRCTHFIAFAFHDSDVMYVTRGAVCGFCSGMRTSFDV